MTRCSASPIRFTGRPPPRRGRVIRGIASSGRVQHSWTRPVSSPPPTRACLRLIPFGLAQLR
eukprot:CAMPEP_0179116768 /NCGR_PEP_ID=MMETSP0796-20121207/54798_1 /TAXON_ID=73915 /ORGANISM="Pyrodinium bahamense, Strain pbaha01" /LENGTH=61 /DNA_ID=CAMNT_0020815085 /DNA_START=73 /DNA_END=254 /DNA_ORIENTATION=+